MDVVHRESIQSFETKDTSTIREILRPETSSVRRQSLAEATLSPGKTTLAHYHPDTEEIYYILQGSGIMVVEHETRTVRSGDAVAIPAGAKHKIMNSSNDDLIFLCCCVPAYRDDDTVLCDALVA